MTNMIRKGQAATEALVLLGFMVTFSIPIILLLYATTSSQTEELSISQARITTRAIADAANEIYAQGVPANRLMLAYYPESIKNITVRSSTASHESGEIIFILTTSKGDTEVLATTFFPDVVDGANGTARRLGDERRAGALTVSGGLHIVNITAVNMTSGRIGVEVSYAAQ